MPLATKGYIFFQPGHHQQGSRNGEKRRGKSFGMRFVPSHCGSLGYIIRPEWRKPITSRRPNRLRREAQSAASGKDNAEVWNAMRGNYARPLFNHGEIRR